MKETDKTMSSVEAKEAARKLREMGFVDPTALSTEAHKAAPRLPSLAGKRAGVLDNRKGNGNLLLADIGEILVSSYDVASVMTIEKWIYSRPAPEDVLARLAEECDFVVTAVGD